MHTTGMDDFRQEPFRLLFPMGLAFGAIGMGIWIPFFFWPGAFPYPGLSHALVQLQGFLLCFILGFLGTMMPKVLGFQPLGPWQFAVFPLGLSAMVLFALVGMPRIAEALHLLVMFNFFLFILRRWKHRTGSPPPPFLFIGLAMAADIAGTGLRILALFGQVGPEALRAAALLQFQAFPLLLILGVGSFLLPKLFTGAVVNPQSLRGIPGRAAPGLLVLGLAFVATYVFEAWGPEWLGPPAVRIAHALRAAIWAWFLLVRIRIHQVTFPQPAYLEGARLSLYAIGAGMLLPIFWPAWILAWEHVLFIGGILWLTLSIAARVATAHGGRLDLLAVYGKRILAYGVLILLAMATRVSADIWTGTRWLHMAVAAALGLAVLGIWAWSFVPLCLRLPARPDKPA